MAVMIIPKCSNCGKYMKRENAIINGIGQSYYYCKNPKKHQKVIEIWMDSRFHAETTCIPKIGRMEVVVVNKPKGGKHERRNSDNRSE